MKTIEKAEKNMSNIEVPLTAINQLAEILKNQELSEIELEFEGQYRIKVKKEITGTVFSSVSAPAVHSTASTVSETASAKAAAPNKNLFEVKSPMVGTYYASPSPDADAFIKVGDRVKKGDTLCIIEAMKLMNELPSEVSGIVKEISVDNSQAISFGEVIIKIEKDA
jgi:acetyl-CoA carboxylase biotin carboxyl carrier protein